MSAGGQQERKEKEWVVSSEMLFSRFPALWFGDTSSPMDMADPGTPQTCLYSQKAFGLSSNPSSPQPALD